MDLITRQGRSKSGNGALAVRRRAVPADFSGVQVLVLAFAAPFRGPSQCSGRTLAVKGQNLPLGDDQIGRRREDVQLGRVAIQSLVANLAMAEEILHDVKRVLDLRADARLDRFQATQQWAKLALLRGSFQLAVPGRHLPVDIPVFQVFALLDTSVSDGAQSCEAPSTIGAGVRLHLPP